MKRLLLAMVLILPLSASAAPNPCYKKPVVPVTIPPGVDHPFTLEAKRVLDIQGKTFTYDLGGKKITIEAADFCAEQLLRDIHRGMCVSKEEVILVPHFLGKGNDRFRTKSPLR